MSNLLDTTLNVVAFAYIGLLFWLYFKPDKGGPDKGDGERDPGQ